MGAALCPWVESVTGVLVHFLHFSPLFFSTAFPTGSQSGVGTRVPSVYFLSVWGFGESFWGGELRRAILSTLPELSVFYFPLAANI